MSVFNFNSGKNMSAYPQIQSDLTATNLNLHCDPRTVGTYFLDPQGNRILDVESKAGKIAVEDDICNLTVNGKLTVKGQAEICDIICPEDFTVRAGRDVKLTAARGGSIQCTTGPLSLEALSGVTASCTVSVIGHLNAKDTSTPAYKPTLITGSWSGLAPTLVGASVDTAGKINIPNGAAVAGDTLTLLFGKAFTQAPVVQISLEGPVGAGQALPVISISQVTPTAIVLRLDVAATGIRNDNIHYTVIGLD